ncbi:MAG: regulator, partial [Massilimaliae sp.]|nr:regulator [Massiliimalia sp.]
MLEKVYTKNAPDAIGPYSQAVKCGGMLFTSGQIAINPASGEVEVATIEAQ